MDTNYAAKYYGERAESYVTSTIHSTGADLDLIEKHVIGKGYLRVLDLGCGGGHVSYRIASHVGEVVACDVTGQMLDSVEKEAAKRHILNIKTKQSLAEKLPFANEEFDAVFCRFTTHHWNGVGVAMSEVKRVLVSDGPAIFIDVISPALPLFSGWLQTLELLRDISHVRNYSIAEWTSLLGEAGFSIREIKTYRLKMEFGSWIARTKTPKEREKAIRSLLEFAPAEVLNYFSVDKNLGFTIDTAHFIAN